MEKNQIARISCLAVALWLFAALPLGAQRLEKVPFGDFEHWAERHIKESAILGGEIKTLWVVGPDEVVEGNRAYDYSKTVWASSNAYAKVGGVTKTSLSVWPEDGPSGRCAHLKTVFASCRVAGVVNIEVLATGSLYWGKMLEPVTGVKDPYSFMDWGIPFTGRPSALVLDYKAVLPNTGMLTKGTTFSHKQFPGKDPAQLLLVLQHRWEDADGRIHALRVGTAVRRIGKSTDGWILHSRVPVEYGDISSSPGFKPWMGLMGNLLYAVNSRGKRVPILEEGWAPEGTPVTHAVLNISAGCAGTFTGELGNELWVDNICLEYP